MTTNPPTDEVRAAALLVAEARAAVHESLGFLAAPEADRVRALVADLETAIEGRTAICLSAVSVPASAPTEGLALQRAADALWALANRTTERGAGVLWAADWLRNRAVALAVPESAPTDDAATAEHHTVDGIRHLCHADDHYCPPVSGSGRVADETQAEARAALIAELLPAWEAVYEPGNVSDYLIGYANDQDVATGAAEAWLRSQAEVTGRLEWVSEEQLATGRYDRWFELIERHGDGIDTGPGVIVRRRVEPAVVSQPDGEA